MARTIGEIQAYLDSLVGTKPVDQSSPTLNGQCVALVKDLNSFLGVPNPFAARGNATSYATTLLNQGLASNGRGNLLTICVNHNYSGGFGHIWIDLTNRANYESNGARALIVTKNTRPITQAQQMVSYDRYVTQNPVAAPTASSPIAVRVKFWYTMHIRQSPSIGAPITGEITAGNIGNFTSETATADGYFWRKGAITGGWVATANAARTVGYGQIV